MFVSEALTIVPHEVFPLCAGRGYSLVFANSKLGERVWMALTGDENPEGPIGIGSLEYETLCIAAGLTAFESEFGKEKGQYGARSTGTSHAVTAQYRQGMLPWARGCGFCAQDCTRPATYLVLGCLCR